MGALVLTVDQLLPPEFALTPQVVAGVGTSAIVLQRAIFAKQIKEALAREESAADMKSKIDALKARAAESPERVASAPPPPPEVAPPVPPPVPLHVPIVAPPSPDELIARAVAKAVAEAEAAEKATLDPLTREPPRYADGRPYDISQLG